MLFDSQMLTYQWGNALICITEIAIVVRVGAEFADLAHKPYKHL